MLRKFLEINQPVAIASLPVEEAKELQQLLVSAGFGNLQIDGVIGAKSQEAFSTFKKSAWLAEPEKIGLTSLVTLLEVAAEATRKIASSESSSPLATVSGFKIQMAGQSFSSNQPIIEGGNFTWGEATHNGTRLMDKGAIANTIKLAKQLQAYREKIGGRWVVTSWYRPASVNSRVGGAKFSQHLTGAAVDLNISVDNRLRSAIEMMPALRNWQGGVGVYGGNGMRNVVHLDCRPGIARWGGALFPQ